VPKLAKFVAKHADDVPKVLDAIIQTSKLFPNADEVAIGLVKILPVGALDNIAKSIKNGDNITKAEYRKLQDVFEAAGKNFDIGNSLKPQKLLDELIDSGEKFTLDKVVAITKMPDGKLVWLEIGKETGEQGSAGLRHIEKHADEFLKVGISKDEIPEFIMTALSKGEKAGVQNTRDIYEVVYKGKKHRVAIDVGSNGFIVGANPKSVK